MTHPVEHEALVRHIEDVVAVVDDAGTFTYLSPSVSTTLGYDPAALTGTDAFDIVHPADVDTVRANFEQSVDGAADTDPEWTAVRVRHADGGWRWLEATVTASGDPSVDGYVVTAHDVTERRRTEARLRHVLSNSSDLVAVLDADGVLLEVPTSAGKALDHDHCAVPGTPVTDHVHPDDVERLREGLERGRDEPGFRRTVECRIRSSDDEWRWLEVRIERLPADSPLSGTFLLVARDVTERKRRERQLARQNERLEAFAALVSHDIRGPLSVARGNLKLFRSSGDESYLDNVERAHDRIGELVSDVLSLARAGLVVDDLEPVDLDDCLSNAVRTSPLDGSALVVDSPLPTVRGDAERLCTLFENLLRNAVTHGAGSDGVTVHVGALDDGFYVADDGPGIPAEEREEVLEPGYSTEGDGLGYGLAIVDSVARAHGWTTTVTEGTTGGARFEFTGVERPDET